MVEIEALTTYIHGRKWAYLRAGEGAVLLLVHGIAGCAEQWEPVIPLLAEKYTVVVPDLLGYGNSDKPAPDYSLGAQAAGLRDLLGVLSIDRATVVGHSFVGGVVMQFAYQHPESCERLILVDSGGLGRQVTWALRLLALPGADLLLPLIFPSFVGSTGNSIKRFLFDRGIRSPRLEESWKVYASLTDGGNRETFGRTLRAVLDPGGQAISAVDKLYLTELMPSLIIWGDRDAILSVDQAYKAHEAMPGSRLELIKGAGHFPHVENPQRFTEIVLDFLETTDAAELTIEDARKLLVEHQAVLDAAREPEPGIEAAQ
jgi:pimeloyl-ACP methyl ester carboxylesterase